MSEPNEAFLRQVVATARTIAVLGAHTDAGRPAYYVPEYMHRRGYTILPVNPVFRGERLFGRAVKGALAELDEPADIIDVFRRSEHLGEHVPDILALRPRPRLVWFQSGIWNDPVATVLRDAGLVVVQDRCLMVDHRAWLG